jgi:hypothetical protein
MMGTIYRSNVIMEKVAPTLSEELQIFIRVMDRLLENAVLKERERCLEIIERWSPSQRKLDGLSMNETAVKNYFCDEIGKNSL